jgi:hypothetical protein
MSHRILAVTVFLASAAWAVVIGWLGRDTNCAIDGCTGLTIVAVVGFSVVLLTTAIAISRSPHEGLPARSILSQSVAFTCGATAAALAWVLSEGNERAEAIVGGLSMLVMGTIAAFVVLALLVTLMSRRTRQESGGG